MIRGRQYLLFDPYGDCDLSGRFDLVYDPKGLRVMTYFMTRSR